MVKNLLITLIILFFSSLSANDKIKNVSISGNERISSETILVYGNIKLDDQFNESKINDILNKLYKTNFFEDINIKLDGNTLNIKVKEYLIINQLLLIGEKSSKIRDELKKIINLKEKNSFIKRIWNNC